MSTKRIPHVLIDEQHDPEIAAWLDELEQRRQDDGRRFNQSAEVRTVIRRGLRGPDTATLDDVLSEIADLVRAIVREELSVALANVQFIESAGTVEKRQEDDRTAAALDAALPWD